MSQSPRLSVLMPVYNGYPYVKLAIESVLHQSYKFFKLVVVNDGSTDQTPEYLATLKDDRVHVISQSNQGLGAALNRGLIECNTEYVARVDSDDVCESSRFEEQVSFLDNHPDIGVLGCRIAYFYDNPDNSGWSPRIPLGHQDIVDSLLKSTHAITHPALIFRKNILNQIGGYQISGIGEDWDLFLRLSEITKIANLNKVLYKMRLHEESVSWKYWSECRVKNRFAIYNYKNRQNNLAEVTFEEFNRTECHSRAYRLISSILDAVDSISVANYRMAIIESLKNDTPKFFIRMVLAGLFGPLRVIRRFRSLVKFESEK